MLNEVQERKRIGVYCRVSTREQAVYGYGIGVQKTKIQGYLELYDRTPDSIVYYIDEGISAKDMHRTEMTRLIKDVEAGLIDEIIIYKLDRLSRSVIDVYEFIEQLLKLDCNLISIMDNIDIHTANGRMLIGLLAIIAQWERETIKERTADGLINCCEQGKFPIGYTPYGYNRNNNVLTINEQEAKEIRKIFELACNGNTIKEIENIFSKASDRIENGRKMLPKSIKRILIKRLYLGEFIYKGTEYNNVVPQIIPLKVFNKANKMISKRFKQYDNNKYYFGNSVRCLCGNILVKSSTCKKEKTYYYYYCEHCRKRINQEKILNSVLPDIYANLNNQTIKKSLKRNDNKIQQINKKMNTVFENYSRGKIDIKIYVLTMTRLEVERKSLEAEDYVKNSVHYTEWDNYNDIEKRKFIKLSACQLIVDIDMPCVVSIKYHSNS